MREILFEGRVNVLGELHVLEHALHLAGEAGPALRLQFTQHTLLAVYRRGFSNQQPEVFFLKTWGNLYNQNV